MGRKGPEGSVTAYGVALGGVPGRESPPGTRGPDDGTPEWWTGVTVGTHVTGTGSTLVTLLW